MSASRLADAASGTVCRFVKGPDAGCSRHDIDGVRVRVCGWVRRGRDALRHGAEAAQLLRALWRNAADVEAFGAQLAELDGHFALVLETPTATIAAVDWVRSRPLFLAEGRDGIRRIGPHAPSLLPEAASRALDADAALDVAAAGYATGERTLYQAVRQLEAGRLAVIDADGVRFHRYRTYRPFAREEAWEHDPIRARDRLAAALESVFSRLANEVRDRPVYVPVSAGLDSRLILTGLARFGCRDLRGYSYGLAGNGEMIAGRALCDRLGVPWRAVPSTPGSIRRFATSTRFRDYMAFADSLASTPFVQDLPALDQMFAAAPAPEGAVFINGNTGDFISGAHTPDDVFELSPGEQGLRAMASAFRRKHFALWTDFEGPETASRIESRLLALIRDLDSETERRAPFALFEALECAERQAKFVVSGQRVYEFMGVDWRLPLWEAPLRDLFESLGPEFKRGQSLYRETLTALDWGGVWRSVPINSKPIRPGWIRPLRFAAKAASAPFGRTGWRAVERRLFNYWTHDLSSYSFAPFTDTLLGPGGFRNPVALRTARYLESHGLSRTGEPIRR